jgi:hypothetical protein
MNDGIGDQLGGHQAGYRFEFAQSPARERLSNRGPCSGRARAVIREGDPEFDSWDVIDTA